MLFCMLSLNLNFVQAQEKVLFEIRVDEELLTIPEGMGEVYIDKNGRTAIPARAIIEGLGYHVEWLSHIQRINVLDSDMQIVCALKIGSKIIELENGQIITMDTKAQIIDGRTYIPLRFVSECLGFEIPKDGGYKFVDNTHYINLYAPQEIIKDKNTLVNDIIELNLILAKRDTSFKFLDSGELFFNFETAMVSGTEKINIGRTTEKIPTLYIGEWNDRIKNFVQDIIYFHAESEEDGDKILNYISQAYEECNQLSDKKALNFGSTTVSFNESDVIKNTDIIIKMEDYLFVPK